MTMVRYRRPWSWRVVRWALAWLAVYVVFLAVESMGVAGRVAISVVGGFVGAAMAFELAGVR